MEWKKIVKVFLRILWMLRLVTPPEENPCPPRPRRKKDEKDDQPPAAGLMTSSKNVSDVIAAEHVGATYSSNCSKLLPRCNLFVELLKTVAKVAGVILAAMGLSSFNEED